MNRLLAFVYLAFVWTIGIAQDLGERVTAFADRECYFAGESLYVRVEASASRVAYVEIADTRRMYAQCMVTLRDGSGWAEIALPANMHSGYYQLTAYTRASQCAAEGFHRSLIGVINAESLSRLDDIEFVPCDSGFSVRPGLGEYVSAQFEPQQGNVPVPEIEGHIVRARVADGTNGDVWQTRLALIGKTTCIYDGQLQPDGTYLYYTSGISGNLPTMVSAYDSLGHMVPMELMSPYLAVLPQQLPRLRVSCNEETLSKLVASAHRQTMLSQQPMVDSLSHSIGFMSVMPDYYYDLDEYTQMNDVHEMLVEFIKGIKRQKRHGVSMLYTFDPIANRYPKWASLVLLDGMPVHDVDEILHYDAHLIRYVQIYSGIFNFGNSCCQGVISLITRRGRLSNYKLKEGELLVAYSFPQEFRQR